MDGEIGAYSKRRDAYTELRVSNMRNQKANQMENYRENRGGSCLN